MKLSGLSLVSAVAVTIPAFASARTVELTAMVDTRSVKTDPFQCEPSDIVELALPTGLQDRKVESYAITFEGQFNVVQTIRATDKGDLFVARGFERCGGVIGPSTSTYDSEAFREGAIVPRGEESVFSDTLSFFYEIIGRDRDLFGDQFNAVGQLGFGEIDYGGAEDDPNFSSVSYDVEVIGTLRALVTLVPEPSSIALITLGLVAVANGRRRLGRL